MNHQTSLEITASMDEVLAPDNFLEDESDWEFELDLIGANAAPEVLREHLMRAPNRESAAAQYLMGYLVSHEATT